MTKSTSDGERSATVILVGGGLANGLIAWRLADHRPDVRVLLIERARSVGGESSRGTGHTWSFHASDTSLAWLDQLATHAWDGYDVRFPTFSRHFGGGYRSIRSDDLSSRLRNKLGDRLMTGVAVSSLAERHVVLDSGETLRADLVIDGRGQGRCGPHAYQKFLGQVLKFDVPHGISRPLLMDATIAQTDGFRFMYLLPFSERELLVEDTYYSATPELELCRLRSEIYAYVRRTTSARHRVISEESGSLPLPLLGAERPKLETSASGLSGGLFHPTTGFSVPEAARFAELVASLPSFLGAAPDLKAYARKRWRAQRFYRRLNNMMFIAALPPERRAILLQFYQRDEALIGRFYAGESTLIDKLKIVSGKPPVPLAKGLMAFVRRASHA